MKESIYNLLKQNKKIYRMMLLFHGALDIDCINNCEDSEFKKVFDEINKIILKLIGVDSSVIEYWYSPSDDHDDPCADTSQTRLELLWDKYYNGRFCGGNSEENVIHELKLLLIPAYDPSVEDEYADVRDWGE